MITTRAVLAISAQDGNVRLLVHDAYSSATVLEMDLSAADLLEALTGLSAQGSARVVKNAQMARVGQRPIYEIVTPTREQVDTTKNTSNGHPSAKMIAYGEHYRSTFAWDTATWHLEEDVWKLHLVRWEHA